MQFFRSFRTAERALEVVEALHMMRKGQVKRLARSYMQVEATFIASLFGDRYLAEGTR
jgi:transposase-like protein